MKVLITGTSGFLGSIIQKKIIGNEIYDLNQSSGNYKINLASTVPHFDIKFDLVIHAAGLAHRIPKRQKEINEFYNVNVIGSLNLLKGLKQSFIPKMFVFISSVGVYGESNAFLINEESNLNASDPYGKSKIESEMLIHNWCKENNVICSILRLPLIVGANPPGNLGSMIKGIQKGYFFNIAEGKAKKSMVLAEDVANSILKVAEIGGIYNLTDGYHPSFFEFSNYISHQLGKGKIINLPMWFAWIIAKVGDFMGSKAPLNTSKLKKITSDLTFDDSKARKAFGWEPTPVLEGFRISKIN